MLVLIYLPVALRRRCASLGKSRYFAFPIKQWSLDWWQRTVDSIEIGMLVRTSLLMAALRHADRGASSPSSGRWPIARYDWRGRRLFQKIVLLPIFFPQPVLGLALLLWFNALGMHDCPGRRRSSRIWSGSCRW